MGHTRDRLRHFLTTTLIGGITVILPIVIFIWVVRLIVTLIHVVINPLAQFIDLEIPELFVDLIAIAIVIVVCFFTGLFIRTRLGNNIYLQVEKRWLEKLPVYASIRDIVHQFTGKKKTPFRRVVLVSPFGSSSKMTGFVADEDDEHYTVFVPTAPNPTNGFVFHVPKEQVKFLDVTIEAAMRTVVGMGAGSSSITTDHTGLDEEDDDEGQE